MITNNLIYIIWTSLAVPPKNKNKNITKYFDSIGLFEKFSLFPDNVPLYAPRHQS